MPPEPPPSRPCWEPLLPLSPPNPIVEALWEPTWRCKSYVSSYYASRYHIWLSDFCWQLKKQHSMSLAIDNTTFNVSSKYSLKPTYMNSVFNVVISEDTHWAQSCSTVDVPWWFHQPLIKDCQCLKMHAFNKILNLDLDWVQNWNQFRDWHHSTLHKWIVLKQ